MAYYSERMKRRSVVVLAILVILAVGGFPYYARPVSIMRVFTWYATRSGAQGAYMGSYRIVLVSVSGPESTSGTTTTDPRNPLTFSLAPGTYAVSGTYDPGEGQILESVNVTVTQGMTVDAFLNFGGPPPP